MNESVGRSRRNMSRPTISALGLLTLLAPLSVLAETGRIPTAQEYAAGLGDRIVASNVREPGHSVSWGRAIAVVDAPISHVRSVVADYAGYESFIPRFRESRVLEQKGDESVVYVEAGVMKNTITLWAELRLKEKALRSGTRVIEGEMRKGNVRDFRARWILTPVDDGKHTLVSFELLVAPRMFLPSSVFSRENRKAAEKVMKALRTKIDEAAVATR